MEPLDKNMWEVACRLLSGHGVEAPAAARRHANERLQADDIIGHGTWLVIAAACKELLRKRGTDAVH